MILLTGATGYIGSELVKQLKAAGVPIRIMTRHPETADMDDASVEIVKGDFSKPETLDTALEGVEKAFLLSAMNPNLVEWQSNFIAAAKRANVQHIVKLSSGGIRPDGTAPGMDGKWHRQAEEKLEQSGLAWTHIRPSFFMQNIKRYFGDTIQQECKFYAPVGDTKAAVVAVSDIAAVAAAALTESGHESQIYLVTGPESLSFDEIANKVSAALNKPVEFVNVPPEQYAKQVKEAGNPDWLVTIMTELADGLKAGGSSEVTNTVEQVAKKQPISLDEFLKEHASEIEGN